MKWLAKKKAAVEDSGNIKSYGGHEKHQFLNRRVLK
jgi:hypothetical protein